MKNWRKDYLIKETPKPQKCILCKKRERDGTLFCGVCAKKGIFTKLKAFRDSDDYKKGWISGGPYNYGKLPER